MREEIHCSTCAVFAAGAVRECNCCKPTSLSAPNCGLVHDAASAQKIGAELDLLGACRRARLRPARGRRAADLVRESGPLEIEIDAGIARDAYAALRRRADAALAEVVEFHLGDTVAAMFLPCSACHQLIGVHVVTVRVSPAPPWTWYQVAAGAWLHVPADPTETPMVRCARCLEST
jgi:hypothetical protein